MKISAGTIARTIALALALINQVLTAMGKTVIDVSNEDINVLISTAFTIITAIAAWWKNNSFTEEAIKADAVLKEAKGK